jgi:hypothetical protein
MYYLNRNGNILNPKNNQSPNIPFKWEELKTVFKIFIVCILFLKKKRNKNQSKHSNHL